VVLQAEPHAIRRRRMARKVSSYLHSQTPGPELTLLTASYVPYKYATEKFVNVAVVDKDQSDPTVYTVLTAKSKTPGTSITDVMVFTPKWCAATKSFRPPVRWAPFCFAFEKVADTETLVLSPQYGNGDCWDCVR
jgi:hypothetical protein